MLAHLSLKVNIRVQTVSWSCAREPLLVAARVVDQLPPVARLQNLADSVDLQASNARREPGGMTETPDLLDKVKPRTLNFMPRCYECKSPDTPLLRGRPPMFHPAHKWGPCDVRMAGGEPCGCTVGVQQSPRPPWLT